MTQEATIRTFEAIAQCPRCGDWSPRISFVRQICLTCAISGGMDRV